MKSQTLRRWALLSLLASISFPATAQVDRETVGIATLSSVHYEVEATNSIGAHRVGTLCLPNGALYWNDLVHPTQDTLESALSEHIDKMPTLRGAAIRKNLKLTVMKARLNLCTPGLPGIGGSPKLKGSMTIKWEQVDDASPPVLLEVSVDVRRSDPRKSPYALTQVIIASFETYLRTNSKAE